MAGSGDLSHVEMGLNIAQQEAPITGTLEAMIHGAVAKSLQEGNAAKAAEQIKNAGQLLTEKKAKDRTDQIFKEDSVDSSGNLVHSTDQDTRKTEAKTIEAAIIRLRNSGFSSLSGAEVDAVVNPLSDALFNHPTIRAIAAKDGVDVTSPTFKSVMKDVAIKILKNQSFGDKAVNSLVQLLESANIDYKNLLNDLDKKKDLDKILNDLTEEIGVEASVGGLSTKLHKEVDDQKERVKRYKTKIVTSGGTQTVEPELGAGADCEAKWKIDAEARLKDVDKNISLYRITSKDVEAYFGKHTNATDEIEITDPDSPSSKIIIVRGDWASKKAEWENKIKDLEDQKLKDRKLIEKIDQQETEEGNKLKQLEEKIKTKKDELAKKLKEKTDLDKKIKKYSDIDEKGSVANQENQFVEDLKNIIINDGLDVWSEASSEALKVKPEVMKTLDEIIKNEVKKYLHEEIYNESNKKFRTKELKRELDNLLRDGVDQYGISRLQVLWNKCTIAGAPPELTKLIPSISEVVDFSGPTPVIKNLEKLKALSADTVTDMLKIVAFKNPHWLEKRFTQDQQAMAKLKGDILPDLIMQAHKDKSLQLEIEKGFGEKLTKGYLKEKIARWNWAEILKWLGIIAGLAALVTVGISILNK